MASGRVVRHGLKTKDRRLVLTNGPRTGGPFLRSKSGPPEPKDEQVHSPASRYVSGLDVVDVVRLFLGDHLRGPSQNRCDVSHTGTACKTFRKFIEDSAACLSKGHYFWVN